MALLDKLRSVFGENERTFAYRCTECDHVFEADTPSESRAACPDCEGSHTVAAPGGVGTVE